MNLFPFFARLSQMNIAVTDVSVPICLSPCLSVVLHVCLPHCVSVCLSVCLPPSLSACPVCLPVCLPVCSCFHMWSILRLFYRRAVYVNDIS